MAPNTGFAGLAERNRHPEGVEGHCVAVGEKTLGSKSFRSSTTSLFFIANRGPVAPIGGNYLLHSPQGLKRHAMLRIGGTL
jgi:hypothetical protein